MLIKNTSLFARKPFPATLAARAIAAPCQHTPPGKRSRRGFCFALLPGIPRTGDHNRVQSSGFATLPAPAVSTEHGFEADSSQLGSLETQASSPERVASGLAFFKASNVSSQLGGNPRQDNRAPRLPLSGAKTSPSASPLARAGPAAPSQLRAAQRGAAVFWTWPPPRIPAPRSPFRGPAPRRCCVGAEPSRRAQLRLPVPRARKDAGGAWPPRSREAAFLHGACTSRHRPTLSCRPSPAWPSARLSRLSRRRRAPIAQPRYGQRGRKEDAGSASPESATESHSRFSSYRFLPKKRGTSPESQNLPFPNSTAPRCPLSPARPRAPGQMTWPTCKLGICWAAPWLASRHVSSRRVPAGFTASPLTSYSKASVIHSSASPLLEY